MRYINKFICFVALLAFLGVGYGCEKEGPAEKAGKKIDQTLEQAGDSIEDVGDKEGPAEKAGKKIDQALEKAGDSIEDAGDKVEDAVNK
ncbi:Rv0909 family putative TA system antitoxin [Paucidesulfovibrio longus]|uniref:Rv0909 family putative TA system antitoxin n=1 Tax=Paucidesulfovibrio longus TaxID=889 RepID=UPI0003B3B79A|nr:Rv0909 family putative TA system antitoxin [Paucidesulfovibrio longus]